MTGLQSPRKNNIIFDNRDGGVAEGVAHAVVEELHAGFGPEEFRGNVQRPILQQIKHEDVFFVQ